MQLVAPEIDAATGLLAWAATRVRLRPTGYARHLPTLESAVQPLRPPEGAELVPTVRPD
jgi:hypothetical protein